MSARQSSLQLAVKRIIDVIGALLALVLLSPLLLLLALLIVVTSGWPIFFRQERVGRHGRIFRLIKFRTMIPRAQEKGAGLNVTRGDPRITPIGAILRDTSLDELPQLLNVLAGDLSLVGPRPVVPAHLLYYGPFEMRRLEMRPGITGLAVVRGRARLPWSVRIRHDVEYVERFNLWLDSVILLRTVKLVLTREATYHDHERDGPAFDLTKSTEPTGPPEP